MIYIVTVIILCFMIMTYDLKGRVNTKDYNKIYSFVMLWFIAVSGFAYNVGSDIPIYMRWYDEVSWDNIRSIKDLYDSESHLMPGWNLLMLLCKSISDNFVFPKMVIAIFCNYVFFRFIKRHSIYPLISVLFYGFTLYLNMNFNALRQMMAVSVFLLSYESLLKKDIVKYYLWIFVAYMFHSSAIICAFFPLLNLFKISRKSFVVSVIIVALLSVILLLSNFQTTITQFLLVGNQYLSSDMIELTSMYLEDIEGSQLNLFGIISVIIKILTIVIVTYFSYDSSYKNDLIFKFALIYCMFYALNFSIGVVFSRLIYYVEFFYLCLLPVGAINLSRKITRKTNVITIILLVILAMRPINNLFRVNPEYDYPLLIQYYPYHTVFDPQIDPTREFLFGSYR